MYANGTIYITSTDTYLYALDATSGAFKFKTIPLNLDAYYTPDKGSRWDVAFFSTATPVVANGLIYIDTGVTMGGLWPASKYAWPGNPSPGGANGGALRFSAFNATTGESVWNMTMAGNSGTVWQPCYYKGNLYMVEFMQVTCMNASNPSGGSVAIRGFMGQPCGNRTWAQWIGYEILSSPTYVDDLRGPKIYVSSDVGSITCLNATSGAPISAYQTAANAESSCAVWEGKLYVGSSDRNVYCFDDSPIVDMTVEAQSSKGSAMFSGETITIGGHLKSNPMETTWNYATSTYVHVASDMNPSVPFENVTISFNKPDGTSVNLTTTTDLYGKFSVSYTPTETGSWGWVAYYDGKRTPGIQYNQAYSDWNPLDVTQGPTSETPTPTIAPTPETGTPTPAPTATPVVTSTPAPASLFDNMTNVAIIAVVIIVILIVAVAEFMTKRKKKTTQ